MRFLCSLLGCLLAAAVWASPAENIRHAAVAGSWYPGDETQLRVYVDNLLQGEEQGGTDHGPVRAIIAPHAAYRFSGAVAAAAYRQVRGQAYKRVLLLGPAHHGWFHGLSIADVTDYETPLGRVPLDLETIQRLRASPLVTSNSAAHKEEHSLEMQLPMLQRSLKPGWKLIPILVGQLTTDEYSAAADLLRPLLGEDTLIVVSSDFTHYGPRYHYLPFPHDAMMADRLEELDSGSLGYILDKDPQGFLRYRAMTGTTICGYQPIAILLYLLPSDIEGELVSYDTSGRMMDDYTNSVSYMGIVFREPDHDAPADQTSSNELSPEDMRLLHGMASAAVNVIADPGDTEARQRLRRLMKHVPAELKRPAGAFVTLWKGDELRGCVGTYVDSLPLYQVVVAAAADAAQNDHRFTPIVPQELPQLELEVNVLSRPEHIASYRDFVLGEDGVIIEKDGHTALFLPEVPKHYHWNREQMLNFLALKAGLPADAWKDGASFKAFRSRKYTARYTDNTDIKGN